MLSAMRQDAELLKKELDIKNREYNNKLREIRKIELQIRDLQRSENLRVSEHAIIRYFERVKGFDIAQIEKEILTEQIRSFVSKLGGSGTYPADGFSVVMKNHVVTTILAK